MGIVLAKREEERIAFNQTRARAAAYLEKCRPDYIEDSIYFCSGDVDVRWIFFDVHRVFSFLPKRSKMRVRMICCWV